MGDLLGMIDQIAETPSAPPRSRTRRGRRRPRTARDETALAETRDAIAESIPEAGLTATPSRDDVLAATRGAIAETMPETQPERRGWTLMSSDDAFGSPRARTVPEDEPEDAFVSPDDEVPTEPARRTMRAPLPPPTVATRTRIGGHVEPPAAFAQRFEEDDSDPMPAVERRVSTESTWEPEIDPDDEAADWEMMAPDEALGPSSRYTADELEAMRRGERHDRGGRYLMAGLSGLGSLVGLIGAARGNLAAQGAGKGLVEGSAGHDFNAYDTAKASAEERIAREDEEAQQAAEMGMRERSLAINERNAASGTENAAANRQMRELAERRNQQEFDAEHNPESPAAENARRRFQSLLTTYGASAGDWSDVVETLPQLGASEIQANIEDLEETVRGRRAPRRGGGSPRVIVPGGGGAAPGGGTATQANPLEAMLRQYAGILRVDPDSYVAYYNSLRGDDQERIRGRMEVAMSQQGGREAGWEHQSGGLPQGVEPRTLERFSNEYRPAFARSRSLAGLRVALARASDADIVAALQSNRGGSIIVNGIDIRARIWHYLNQYFHEFGGANITPNEMDRYRDAFGAGSIAAGAGSFRAAIQRSLQSSQSDETEIAAGFAPQYQQFWMQNRQHGGGGR